MKKLIVMDPVRICGSDLTSGTSDEKRECMGYDNDPILSFSHFSCLFSLACILIIVSHLPLKALSDCCACNLSLNVG
jgi:hypothetical protein